MTMAVTIAASPKPRAKTIATSMMNMGNTSKHPQQLLFANLVIPVTTFIPSMKTNDTIVQKKKALVRNRIKGRKSMYTIMVIMIDRLPLGETTESFI